MRSQNSTFHIRFFDQYSNSAIPKPTFKLGLALLYEVRRGAPGNKAGIFALFRDVWLPRALREMRAENEKVASHKCVACPAGKTNDKGDDASGSDTTCDGGCLRGQLAVSIGCNATSSHVVWDKSSS